MLIIKTDNEIKRIVKKNAKFAVNSKVVDGEMLIGRVDERLKK